MKLECSNILNMNDFRVPNLYILKELWRYNKIVNNEINNRKYTREKWLISTKYIIVKRIIRRK
jgi:hypothetical protein